MSDPLFPCPLSTRVTDSRKWYIPNGKTSQECTCEYCYEKFIKETDQDIGFTWKNNLVNCNCDYPKEIAKQGLINGNLNVLVLDANTLKPFPLNSSSTGQFILPTCSHYIISVRNLTDDKTKYITLVSCYVGDRKVTINNDEDIHYKEKIDIKGFETGTNESFYFVSLSNLDKTGGMSIGHENKSNIIKLRIQQWTHQEKPKPRRLLETDRNTDYLFDYFINHDKFNEQLLNERKEFADNNSRYIPSLYRPNEKLFDEVKVTPGLDLKYDEIGTQGYFNLYRPLSKDVDSLRSFNKTNHFQDIAKTTTKELTVNIPYDHAHFDLSKFNSIFDKVDSKPNLKLNGGATVKGNTKVDHITTQPCNDIITKYGEEIEFDLQLMCAQNEITRFDENQQNYRLTHDMEKRRELLNQKTKLEKDIEELDKKLTHYENLKYAHRDKVDIVSDKLMRFLFVSSSYDVINPAEQAALTKEKEKLENEIEEFDKQYKHFDQLRNNARSKIDDVSMKVHNYDYLAYIVN